MYYNKNNLVFQINKDYTVDLDNFFVYLGENHIQVVGFFIIFKNKNICFFSDLYYDRQVYEIQMLYFSLYGLKLHNSLKSCYTKDFLIQGVFFSGLLLWFQCNGKSPEKKMLTIEKFTVLFAIIQSTFFQTYSKDSTT